MCLLKPYFNFGESWYSYTDMKKIPLEFVLLCVFCFLFYFACCLLLLPLLPPQPKIAAASSLRGVAAMSRTGHVAVAASAALAARRAGYPLSAVAALAASQRRAAIANAVNAAAVAGLTSLPGNPAAMAPGGTGVSVPVSAAVPTGQSAPATGAANPAGALTSNLATLAAAQQQQAASANLHGLSSP